VQNRDALGARHLAQMFVDVYPDIDVLIVDPGGSVLAQVGCVDPPSQIAGIVSMADLAAGKSVRGIGAHGCESPTSQAPPAFLLGASIEGGSGVVVCLPLDAGYLQNASAKLGLELALGVLPSASGARVVGHTPNFPAGALAVVSHESTIVDVGPRSWAVARFEPHGPVGALGQIGMIAALDVTDIRLIVRRNLAYALCALAVASALSLWIGWRVASVMSLALRRVSEALLRVERLDYVHVEPVKTGCRSDRDVGIAGISAS
jgi:adenylate cyclase